MLELKGITKIYKPEKSAPVTALNKVDLSFGDRGMVFVLGKSGSGKSTLLNVIDGLDGADGGEIVIDGKSSLSFGTGDYDAYRNTYIGFIFQEYNLLDEFTVAENISLALELQGKKASIDKVNSILRKVDLEGYNKRKTDELSGGQRQRVAIARALIKDPKIIMADEPTGALDSQTGKAVFETLKRLAEDKLVIVVTHDRAFAEEYGDRIIELADGKVIADVNKDSIVDTLQAQKSNIELIKSRLPYRRAFQMGMRGMRTKPIRLIVAIILCVISFGMFGFVHTAASYDKKDATVKSIMKSGYEAVSFTSVNGISSNDLKRLKDESGVDFIGVVNFSDGDNSLPLRNKNALKSKDSSGYYNGSFAGFISSDALLFNDMGFELIGNVPKAENQILITKYMYEQFALCGITYSDENGEEKSFEGDSISTPEKFLSCNPIFPCRISQDEYAYFDIVGILDTKADRDKRFEILKPDSQSNELTLSEYSKLTEACAVYFDTGFHSLLYLYKDAYDTMVSLHSGSLNAFGEAVPGEFRIRDVNRDVYCEGRFESVASSEDVGKMDYVRFNGGDSPIANNELIIGVNAAAKLFSQLDNVSVTFDEKYFDGAIDFSRAGAVSGGRLKEICDLTVYLQYAESASVDDINAFKNYFYEKKDEYGEMVQMLYFANCVEVFIDFWRDGFAEEITYDFETMSDAEWRMAYAGYLSQDQYNYFDRESGNHLSIICGYSSNVTSQPCGFEMSQRQGIIKYVKLFMDNKINAISGYMYYKFSDVEYNKTDMLYNIVGVYFPEDDAPLTNDGYYSDMYVFNDYIYMMAQRFVKPAYQFAIAPMPQDRSQLTKIVELNYDDSIRPLTLMNAVIKELDNFDDIIESLRVVFFYIALGTAVFSIVLMSNYFIVAISDRKREIGILRALGAKTSDTFAIFAAESFAIALTTFVFACIMAVIACAVFDAMLNTVIMKGVSLFNFGIPQIALLFAISLAVAFAASFVPIIKLSRKKPIDCINDR